MTLKSYRDLEVWQKSIEFIVRIYELTKKYPDAEKLGLIIQTQRATVSIAANIAEGYGRSHRGDYRRQISFAKGSVAEVGTLSIVASRLNYASKKQWAPLWKDLHTIGRMLHKLEQALNAQQAGEARPFVRSFFAFEESHRRGRQYRIKGTSENSFALRTRYAETRANQALADARATAKANFQKFPKGFKDVTSNKSKPRSPDFKPVIIMRIRLTSTA